MKKLFLTAAILLGAWQTAAAVDNEVVVDGVVYTWVPEQSAYVASGWDQVTPIRDLHIRSVVNDLDVASIADNAFNFSVDENYYSSKPPIESLVIDPGVTSIGVNAFVDCTSLATASIPGTVEVIGDAAFFRCSALKVLLLNEGLKKIRDEAFSMCTALETVVIPASVTDIGSAAFLHCTGVTDAYFLMTAAQLSGFDWWDGTVEHNGGTEFNTNAHTIIHVPQGLRQDYINSAKFSAWLGQIEEDDGVYPLWWIVNYGTVGKSYTVKDDLDAIYVDVTGDLYCKDYNHWLTPDVARDEEYDVMPRTGLLDDRGRVYDQSNWVVLSGLSSPADYKNRTITGGTITGVLRDKLNPVIEVTSTPVADAAVTYVPNTFVPASVMTRTQVGTNGRTYAFVRPKPQEYGKFAWSVYYENDEFYLPAPAVGGNEAEIKGGFKANYDLYEDAVVPALTPGSAYTIMTIVRRVQAQPATPQGSPRRITPYVAGGLTTTFTVFPLSLPSSPITGITGVRDDAEAARRYNVMGQPVGDTYKGLVIMHGKKTIAK